MSSSGCCIQVTYTAIAGEGLEESGPRQDMGLSLKSTET